MKYLACTILALIVLGGCAREESADHDDHGPADGAAHDHEEAERAGHGTAVQLGTATIGGFTVRAARGQGEVQPGGELALDVWVSGGSGKVSAVRFWIGSEDASGSIKARADVEDPAEPDHWHAHAEVPAPLPPGSRFWVELEIEGQGRSSGSFDLSGH
jgi:hypothetical protein